MEIDLKQIDPTIQSISKFVSSYKTIEISNLNNLQVECGPPEIENFIPDRNVNLLEGDEGCTENFGSLSDLILQERGRSQTDKINFPNIFTIDTKEITNNIQTFEPIAYTNGLPSGNYQNTYANNKKNININFLLQITKLSDTDKEKIKEIYLQAYYTNNVKLKIRLTKLMFANLSATPSKLWIKWYFGNNKEIVVNVSNPNVVGIRNKSDNPVKITFKPR